MISDRNLPFDDGVKIGTERTLARRRPTVAAAIVIVLFALFDMAIMPILSSYNIFNPRYVHLLLSLAMFGTIVAQICLHSVWAVLGQTSAWHLRVGELAVGALWLIAWGVGTLIGLVVNGSNSPHIKVLWLGLFLPVVCLGAQGPLWPLRVLLRWRIEFNVSGQPSTPSLSLSDLIWTTGKIAVALGAARFACQGSNGFEHVAGSDQQFWRDLAYWTFAAAVTSSIGAVPAVGMILGARKLIWGMGCYLGYATFSSMLTICIVVVFIGAPPFWSEIEIGGMLAALLIGFVTALTLPLWWARISGICLKWGRDSA